MINIKQTLFEILSDSTVYGVPHLVKKRSVYSKILWVIFIIVASLFCTKFTYDSVMDYLNYETVTKVSYIYENPTQFPTLTFCSATPANTTFSESIKSCYFGFDSGCGSDPYDYFELFENEIFENCFRFNSGRNNSRKPIPILNSIVGGRDDSFYISTTFSGRFFLWIHNYTKTPKLISYLDGDVNRIMVGQTFYTVIEIEKTVISRQPRPFNNCFKNVSDFDRNKTIIEYFKRVGESYNQADCINLCFDLDYIENKPCDCNSTLGNVWMDCFYGYDNKNLSGCTYNYRYKFSREKILTKCTDYCPEECDYTLLSTSVNIVKDLDINTRVRVYYKSLKYTLISEEPKFQIFDLISNIGGILGLFIGFGFVTLAEILNILLEMLIMLKTKRNKISLIDDSFFKKETFKNIY